MYKDYSNSNLFFLLILKEKKVIFTKIKGNNFVEDLQNMKHYDLSLDLVNVCVTTKFLSKSIHLYKRY